MKAALVRDPRYGAIDAWRGVACLMVVVFHAGAGFPTPAPGSILGWNWVDAAIDECVHAMEMGVPLFFVISGYCIAASAEANRRKGKWSWRFMVRRLRRIFPTYWASLTLFVGVFLVQDALGLPRPETGSLRAMGIRPPSLLTVDQWVGNLTLSETWRVHFWGHDTHYFTGVGWTLCYEEQFYLVTFGLLVFFPGRLFAAFAGVTVACGLLRAGAYDSGALATIKGGFPYLWHEFAVGVAVYWRLNLAESARARSLVDLGLVALFVCGVATGFATTTWAAGFGLVLIALRVWEGRLPRLPGSGALFFCGHRSYSIYLTHMPICNVGLMLLYGLGLRSQVARVLVVIPAITLASVTFGWAFFWVVERHFLPGRRPGDDPNARAGSGLAA